MKRIAAGLLGAVVAIIVLSVILLPIFYFIFVHNVNEYSNEIRLPYKNGHVHLVNESGRVICNILRGEWTISNQNRKS